jgi:hypothetical protein
MLCEGTPSKRPRDRSNGHDRDDRRKEHGSLSKRDNVGDDSEHTRKNALTVRRDDMIKINTAPPIPAIARPTIRATEVGATPHINEPTTYENETKRMNLQI